MAKKTLEYGPDGYLKDGTNFDGIDIKPQEHFHEEDKTKLVKCPVCKGHGGWNIKLDAYGKGKHFQAFCTQCTGWGWVIKGSKDETCIHETEEISHKEAQKLGVQTWGMFCHVYRCKKCGQTAAYDSSG